MRQADAVRLLASPELEAPYPQTWADLGCGDGVFTRALASLLAPRSTIHAMDRDAAALRALPAEQHGVLIRPWTGDITEMPWPFGTIDGLLLANVLHYVTEQPAFLRGCREQLTHGGHLIVVEYDTNRANPWVPYPVSRAALSNLCIAAGFARVVALGSRLSIYQRAALYSVIVAKE
jgi:trans-aconitate methyltransferase